MKNKYGEKVNFRYNLKLYWSLLRKYKWALVGTLFFVLLLEAAITGEKYLFKIVIDNGTSFSEGKLLTDGFLHVLLIIGVVFMGFILVKALSNLIYLRILNNFESKLIADLKRKFFNHLISLDHSFHVSHKTGSLISRLSRGGSAIERMTDIVVFNCAPIIFQIIIVGVALAGLSLIPLGIMIITMIIFVGFTLYIQQKQQPTTIIATKAEDIEKGTIADIFTNVDSIKYFGKGSYIQRKYEKISEKTREKVLKNWNYSTVLGPMQVLILGFGTLALIYFSITDFLAGKISLGTLAFIYTIYGSLLSELNSFVRGLRDLYRVMADFEALFQYNKIEKDIKDKENAPELEIQEGTIEFKKIDFNYGKREIFKNFSLKINKNEKIALVGHSGCGKTTLIKLLYRFYDVNKGEILVDGKDIRDVKQDSLRNEMSVVPQDCVLFDDSIYNNISFSNPKASREEVLQAMKFAQLDKIIKIFPNKENTIVGERGVRLSGGEKQRVSIARAILANKKVLVLDEATSSLDSETEYEIKRDLENLMQGRTSIIIAHRLSTIMRADKIVVMKQGKIVQMGKHNELIDLPGEYKKLWNLQKGGYIR